MMIWTIKELYDYAVANGIENYLLLVDQEGCATNCSTDNMEIDHENEEVYL